MNSLNNSPYSSSGCTMNNYCQWRYRCVTPLHDVKVRVKAKHCQKYTFTSYFSLLDNEIIKILESYTINNYKILFKIRFKSVSSFKKVLF